MKLWFRIASIVFWTLLVAGAGVLLGFVESEQYYRRCRQVYITVEYGKSDILISRDDIDSIIRRTSGNLKGKPLGWINADRIEDSISAQPYVAMVDIYESHDGNVFVEVKQREPILRIINRDHESYYLDRSGNLLPINPRFPARVLVANGYISQSRRNNPNYRVDVHFRRDSLGSDSLMQELYQLAMFINGDKFLKAQIEQIYVTPGQEFELIPRVGNHVILFGRAEQMEDKFRRLFLFYTRGLNSIGWNRYNIINIKYNNQVVCSKI